VVSYRIAKTRLRMHCSYVMGVGQSAKRVHCAPVTRRSISLFMIVLALPTERRSRREHRFYKDPCQIVKTRCCDLRVNEYTAALNPRSQKATPRWVMCVYCDPSFFGWSSQFLDEAAA
jgi:hypothetical protein